MLVDRSPGVPPCPRAESCHGGPLTPALNASPCHVGGGAAAALCAGRDLGPGRAVLSRVASGRQLGSGANGSGGRKGRVSSHSGRSLMAGGTPTLNGSTPTLELTPSSVGALHPEPRGGCLQQQGCSAAPSWDQRVREQVPRAELAFSPAGYAESPRPGALVSHCRVWEISWGSFIMSSPNPSITVTALAFLLCKKTRSAASAATPGVSGYDSGSAEALNSLEQAT